MMKVAPERTVVVSLAEMHVSGDSFDVLTCLGLGSCIGLSVHDPVAKIGGMAHIVLPSSEGRPDRTSVKYADAAVPLLVDAMERSGASVRRLVIKIAGGAEMTLAPGVPSFFKIGTNNIEAVKASLASRGLKLTGADVGGNHGRSMRLSVGTGRVTVSTGNSLNKDI